MNMLYTSDGKAHPLFSRNSFVCLVGEYMGQEAEKYVAELDADVVEAEARVETDCNNYEANLEENADCFRELLASLHLLENDLSQPRIKKDKALKRISHMKNQINQQI